MNKNTKLDEKTKVKLIYSGELLFFAIVFLVIGIIQLCNVWKLSDRFLVLFNWITIFGATILIGDFLWGLFSSKRRKKISLLDKILVVPAEIYVIILDIMMFCQTGFVSEYRNSCIPPIFVYFAIIYTFEAIYHYKYPIPGLMEEIEEASFELKEVSKENSEIEYKFYSTLKSENGFENNAYGISYDEYINKYLPGREKSSKGIDLPEGYVPDTHYILYKENTPVGVFKVRHYLNDFLINGAGHIGYAIGEEYRGKGYAKIGLKLAIKKLKKMKDFKEDEIYMSCNIDNKPSLAVQLDNGAYIHHKDDKAVYTRIKVRK